MTTRNWNGATDSIAIVLLNDQDMLKKTRRFIRSENNTMVKRKNLRSFLRDNDIKPASWTDSREKVDYCMLVDELIEFHYEGIAKIIHEDAVDWVANEIMVKKPGGSWLSNTLAFELVLKDLEIDPEIQAHVDVLSVRKAYNRQIYLRSQRGSRGTYKKPACVNPPPSAPETKKKDPIVEIVEWVVTDVFFDEERMDAFVDYYNDPNRSIEDLQNVVKRWCDRVLNIDELTLLNEQLYTKALVWGYNFGPMKSTVPGTAAPKLDCKIIEQKPPRSWADLGPGKIVEESLLKKAITVYPDAHLRPRSTLMKKPLFETRAFYDDAEVSHMSDEQIVHEIASLEKKAEELKKVKTESKKITEQVEDLLKAAEKLAEFLDGREDK